MVMLEMYTSLMTRIACLFMSWSLMLDVWIDFSGIMRRYGADMGGSTGIYGPGMISPDRSFRSLV